MLYCTFFSSCHFRVLATFLNRYYLVYCSCLYDFSLSSQVFFLFSALPTFSKCRARVFVLTSLAVFGLSCWVFGVGIVNSGTLRYPILPHELQQANGREPRALVPCGPRPLEPPPRRNAGQSTAQSSSRSYFVVIVFYYIFRRSVDRPSAPQNKTFWAEIGLRAHGWSACLPGSLLFRLSPRFAPTSAQHVGCCCCFSVPFETFQVRFHAGAGPASFPSGPRNARKAAAARPRLPGMTRTRRAP